MAVNDTLPPGYFDKVYAASVDPWQFATSDYERAKYAATVAALPKPHFEHAFEIGCSIGILTSLLAQRCSQLLAVDVNDAALQAARQRLSAQPNVQLLKMVVPQEFPDACFDLIVLSEVGYYWSHADLALASQRITQALNPGAALLLVHWTPAVHDYPLTGDEVHAHFMALSGDHQALRHVHLHRHATYRLDVFKRAGMAV